MTEQSIQTLLPLGLLILGCTIAMLAGRAKWQRNEQELNQMLLRGLELLQGVQRHRALGGQTGREAVQRCQELVAQLGPAWRDWTDKAHLLTWNDLQRTPGDFEGHCRLLERLLGRIQHLEYRRCYLLKTAPVIAERCWQVEDLGRLRGLSIRAAAQQQCPLELRIQLQYLHDRLHTDADRPLHEALTRLRHELLREGEPGIQPAQLYALLTPLIDSRIEGIRRTLGH